MLFYLAAKGPQVRRQQCRELSEILRTPPHTSSVRRVPQLIRPHQGMAKDTFIMDKITIAYDELIAGKDPKNPQTPYTQYHMVKTFVNNNGLGYDSLTEALQALDKSIQPTDTPGEAHPLRWFPTVTVCIGPGDDVGQSTRLLGHRPRQPQAGTTSSSSRRRVGRRYEVTGV